MRIWSFQGCEYDEEHRQFWIRGKLSGLGAPVIAVLAELLRSAEHACTSLHLSQLWGPSGSTDSVKDAVRQLRGAMAKGGVIEEVIRTLRGKGFQIVGSVAVREYDPAVIWKTMVKGAPAPLLTRWVLLDPLEPGTRCRVWRIGQQDGEGIRVVKYATDETARDRAQRAALRREARAWAALERGLPHTKNFVRIISSHLTTSPCYLESEFGGPNLAAWFKAQRNAGGPSRETCLGIMADLAEAVGSAHSLGIIHNDLKPANILIAPAQHTEGKWQVKIADFGIASVTRGNRLAEFDLSERTLLPGSSGPKGTTLYHAPEVVPGTAPTPEADVYALGVILFQLLSGDSQKAPYPGWEREIADPILQADIAAACNIDPVRRPKAPEFAEWLRTVEARRVQRDAEEQHRLVQSRNEAALARQRLRRPWVLLAACALVLGAGFSFWFYLRAAHQRDLAVRRADTLASMNSFLTVDLLAQGNPLIGPAQKKSALQETLVEAIDRAATQIDRRFVHDPEAAGQLHLALAGALDGRTDFPAAVREFAAAAQRFREADGSLSEFAIIAELRRENTQFRTQVAGSMDQARAGYAAQQKLIAQRHSVSAELQGWQALAGSSTLVFSPHPEQAVDLLKAVVQRADSTPGFPPSLLDALRLRFCGVYLKLNQGAEAEAVARRSIADEGAIHGQDSPALFQARMYLEEALYIQGKYPEVRERSDRDVQDFSRSLGPNNQLTLSALFMRAETESALQQYDDATRDDLAVRDAALTANSGSFLPENALLDAASSECEANHFAAGIGHALQVIRESGPGATNQPYFVNTATVALALCLIGQQEKSNRTNPATLSQAEHLLDSVDPQAIHLLPGPAQIEGVIELAKARIDLLQRKTEAARSHANRAASLLNGISPDLETQSEMEQVRRSLQRQQ